MNMFTGSMDWCVGIFECGGGEHYSVTLSPEDQKKGSMVGAQWK